LSNLAHTTVVQLVGFDEEDMRVETVLVSADKRQYPQKALVYPLSETSPRPPVWSSNMEIAEAKQESKMVAVRFQIVKAFNPTLYAKAARLNGEGCPNLVFDHDVRRLASIRWQITSAKLSDAATSLVKVPHEVANEWVEHFPNPIKGTFVSISPEKGAPKDPGDRFTPITRPPGMECDEYWEYAVA
jgi:hypothetical protein